MDPYHTDKNMTEQTTCVIEEPHYYDTKRQQSEQSDQQPNQDGIAVSSTSERGNVFHQWAIELLASFLSVASLVAIIVVLWIENGRALDEWRWKIGPTAVISFISTISKSALLVVVNSAIGQLKWRNFYGRPNSLADLQLFDDSARGVIGAARLIWHKNVKALLASIAAFIVIISLLVDPFVQLAFTFKTASRLVADEFGTVQRTQVYDPNGYILDTFFTAYGCKC